MQILKKKKTKKSEKQNPVRNRDIDVHKNDQHVFSYRSARNDVDRAHDRQSADKIAYEELHAKPKKSNKFMKTVSFIVMVIAVLFGVTFIRGVSNVVIVGGGANTEAVKQYALTADGLSRQQPVIHRSFLTLNKELITNSLRQEYPEIQSADYSYSPFTQKIAVKVNISKSLLRVQSADIISVVDSNGRIIENTYGDINALPLLIDADNRDYKKGDLAFTSKELNYIYNIQAQAAAKELEIESLTLVYGATELYVKFKDLSYIVKFALDSDPRISFGTFIVARDKSGDKPSEYIDVRVVDRAYIK
jgi:cell division septal protein FtsQ